MSWRGEVREKREVRGYAPNPKGRRGETRFEPPRLKRPARWAAVKASPGPSGVSMWPAQGMVTPKNTHMDMTIQRVTNTPNHPYKKPSMQVDVFGSLILRPRGRLPTLAPSDDFRECRTDRPVSLRSPKDGQMEVSTNHQVMGSHSQAKVGVSKQVGAS